MTREQKELIELIQSYIEIDMHDLARGWAEHSGRYFKLSLRLATARNDCSEAKINQDLCQAQMMDKIGSNPTKYSLTKTTDAAIKAAVVASKEYQAATERVNETKFAQDILQGGLDAMDHRKRALENIVTLRGQAYFADPVDNSGGEAERHLNREAALIKNKVKLNFKGKKKG